MNIIITEYCGLENSILLTALFKSLKPNFKNKYFRINFNFKNATFIVCYNSSILHLSDSMNLKNISLFGQSNFLENKPNNPNSIFVNKGYNEANFSN